MSDTSTIKFFESAEAESKRIAELEEALARTARDTAPDSWYELQTRLFEARSERIERVNRENRLSLEELVGHKL